jgi:hypothetical protein
VSSEPRVKWCGLARRWVPDATGVPLAVARAKGGPLPRREAVEPEPRARVAIPAAPRPKYDPAAQAREYAATCRRVRLAAAIAVAKANTRALLKAAAKERARVKRKAYFAAWYSINRGREAERRKAQRASRKQVPQ